VAFSIPSTSLGEKHTISLELSSITIRFVLLS
jgi:hypothetical protein